MKLFGILAILTVAWLSSSTFLMWILAAVHNWWTFVPAMPFGVSMKISALVVGAAAVNGILKAILESDS